MIILKKILFWFLLILSVNQVIILTRFNGAFYVKGLIGIVLTLFYFFYNFNPRTTEYPAEKLTKLSACYNILQASAVVFSVQALIYLSIITIYPIHWVIFLTNFAVSLLLCYFLVINGLIRSFTISRQIGLLLRIALLSFWWMPFFNSIFSTFAAVKIKQELIFDNQKYVLNQKRKEKQVCKTKYPIVMVHGIFFRDWEIFNYWGRIPEALEDNGAQIFYGEHESSIPVEQAAIQIRDKILSILAQTGANKVNIIAHSKGGIDSRYAISVLGLAPYVASLTTINSPHYGSDLAGRVLSMTPEKIVTKIGNKYSNIFMRLGDTQCDFVESIKELTPERCGQLNRKMTDSPDVYYQSVGSSLKSRRSASFPLNLGYALIKPIAGDNDGLVATKSMQWGNFLGILRPKGKIGISHSDMIDLSRKNIKGFDVMEFYVQMLSELKEKGY
ncbi:MAG: triacylglycerol lipase [Streptococcaceae bacterium]|nr:triacylglycerol lipase [Streptococcaceae bacterium]